ncbi:MAG TPA: FtsX-like permease family protein [Anaerolineales bacterium]|nr:FtsX-like permease family protein [Anaerolineales bacterium]
MYYRTIRNDILRNKAITLTIVMFVAAAAMLVSLAAILVVNLSGAIDTLMNHAKTPHFMQMHSGEMDSSRLSAFVEQHNEIDEYQVLEFLNIDGAQIIFEEGSLADSVQDNGISMQSEKFDYLLDLDGNAIQVSDGEIYVPIPYMQEGLAKVGDKVQVAGKEFTVAGFARDSQMNSLLSSSKRFLVSANDYADIRNFGNVEYLIEFRLVNLSALSAFETAYISAGFEANGPTITYPLFKLLNGLSDGLMIGVILLISALVIAVAFLCIRFTLLAKIEEDYREIGVMKAIGLRVSDIKKIYLVQYAAIAALGSMLGFTLSFVFRGMLLENIRLYMGESESASFGPLFGVIGVLLVFLAIIAYVNGVLKRFRKIPPAEAIRFGISQEKSSGGKHFRLSRLLNTNIFLGMKDVLTRRNIYVTMLAVLVISSFIIIVPQNLHNTISSNDFITYLGIGISDLRIDIQQTSHISEKVAEIVTAMENDNSISRYVVLTTKTFIVKMDDGSDERIKVELGDHSVFPLAYSEGRAPVTENEIALSVVNADEMGKKTDDAIVLIVDGQEKMFTVSGIYSDITNGGKTAKAVFSNTSADTMWVVISADLLDASLIDAKISEYANSFDFAKVSGIDEYIAQTFGATILSVRKASYAALVIALTITVLITLLFMKMLVTKDGYSIAVMKAFGFTNSDIQTQYVARSVFVLVIGILLGTFLANTLGEVLAGAVIASLGASSFKFAVNPLVAYLLSPLLMMGAVLVATFLGTLDAGQIKISEKIKE